MRFSGLMRFTGLMRFSDLMRFTGLMRCHPPHSAFSVVYCCPNLELLGK
jgi:hypothetical protein